jgi:hypothetical protein
MAMPRYQSAGQIHSIKTDSSSFERVEYLKYFGTTLKIKILFGKISRTG